MPVLAEILETDMAAIDADLPIDAPSPLPSTFAAVLQQRQPQSQHRSRHYGPTKFINTFGWLGVPMVLVFIVCAAWTFILAYVQVYPSETANYIMNTTQFDEGEFWLLPYVSSGITACAVVLLSSYGIGYVGLVLLMVAPELVSKYGRMVRRRRPTARGRFRLARNSMVIAKAPHRAEPTLRSVLYKHFGPHGTYARLTAAVLDLPKLVFQSVVLITYLQTGLPLPLIICYLVMLCANWVISAYRHQRHGKDPRLVAARLLYLFDLFFAVFAPLIIFVYACVTFQFDRAAFQVRLDVFPPGSYENAAVLYGDPTQISRFRIAFHSLQYSSASSLVVKSVLNYLSLYKWYKVITILQEQQQQHQTSSLGHGGGLHGAHAGHHVRGGLPRSTRSQVVRQRLIQLAVPVTFLLIGIALCVYTGIAISSSQRACHRYSQCTVMSYQWQARKKQCPCLVFIDRTTPTSWAEWADPMDISLELGQVAMSGDLHIVQVVNRKLPQLPMELRRCTNLEQLTLLYTKTEMIPDWLSELSMMQRLHYEAHPLQMIPNLDAGLFSDMPSLTLLHLGGIRSIPAVPSLANLSRLRYLVIALGHSLTELPSFTDLRDLVWLSIVDTYHVSRIPSVAHLTNLKSFALIGRNEVCCNGFISNTCNLTDFQCLPRSNERATSCINDRWTPEDWTVIRKTGAALCNSSSGHDLDEYVLTSTTTDVACGGIMYKQCTLFGMTGICFNTRMQAISCDVSASTAGDAVHKDADVQFARPSAGDHRSALDSVVRTDIVDSSNVAFTAPALEATVLAPSSAGAPTALAKSSPTHTLRRPGFFDHFGWLGLPMVLMLLMCSIWSFILAFVQIHPTDTANYIMNTASFSDGEFWLLPHVPKGVAIASAVLLSVFGTGYLALVAMMILPSTAATFQRYRRVKQPMVLSSASSFRFRRARNSIAVARVPRRSELAMVVAAHRLFGPHGKYAQLLTAALDLPKLVFQSVVLVSYLQNGFPLPLIIFYLVMLCINWYITSYRHYRLNKDPDYIAARLLYLFDLFFAVFSPLVVLIYAASTFEFDRAGFQVRFDTLNLGSYERKANLFADPTQTSRFRFAFHSLQYTSASSLIGKSALNLLSIYKWHKVLAILLSKPPHTSTHSPPRGHHVASLPDKAIRVIVPCLFVAIGTGIAIYTIVAVATSSHWCSRIHECAVQSYRWQAQAHECACLVFVERHTPVTWADWQSPVDVSDHLGTLAAAGDLRIVQIINRAVPRLPVELRKCSQLEQLILIYTKTEEIPSWLGELTELEYFHYEGDFVKSIPSLPPNLFDKMPSLTLLQLGGIPNVTSIPSLATPRSLRYLVLVIVSSLVELPDLTGQTNLVFLSIVGAERVQRLPSVASLSSLKSFALVGRNPVCCNGFLYGTCDLSNYHCYKRANEPAVPCTNEHWSSDDWRVMNNSFAVVCATKSGDVEDSVITRESTDVACGGIMYKQCSWKNVTGMCFNARMQAISCDTSGEYQPMREKEIALGVGTPCNASIEAWLGCKS
ncbi:TPA: hypothetical protein N0F65_006434 [Lagenidium giganteum]|uniref:WLGC domain-containing protein n=1 Tax=Lagenidium giganteum TaxID=4803 RepID=A0AAV2Z7A2_9STRA|nr:TPA: hypothetical protein N0F65_006434 [Lagenidium giganteum]